MGQICWRKVLIDYHGSNGYTAKAPAKYDPLVITDTSDGKASKKELVARQQSKTDFLTSIKMCATYGIDKCKSVWTK